MVRNRALDEEASMGAAALAAWAAVDPAVPRAITSEFAFLRIIGKYQGNGTLAAGSAGVSGDAVVLPEPRPTR